MTLKNVLNLQKLKSSSLAEKLFFLQEMKTALGTKLGSFCLSVFLTHTHIHTHANPHTITRTHAHRLTHTHTHTHAHRLIHTHTHTHAHPHTHTHTIPSFAPTLHIFLTLVPIPFSQFVFRVMDVEMLNQDEV